MSCEHSKKHLNKKMPAGTGLGSAALEHKNELNI
jgi:hypothetical protein